MTSIASGAELAFLRFRNSPRGAYSKQESDLPGVIPPNHSNARYADARRDAYTGELHQRFPGELLLTVGLVSHEALAVLSDL